jgi:hypothetical protein
LPETRIFIRNTQRFITTSLTIVHVRDTVDASARPCGWRCPD